MSIHPTAIVADGAEVHESVAIGPYSIVEAGACIGPGCVIDSHVRIYGPTRLGSHNRVCHGATIGVEPQDLGYTPERAKPLTIGDHNHFKEGVNISHGLKTDRGTVVGSHNYLMAFAHIGHDALVGDYNIVANTAALGGHVELADHCFLSGHVAVHQFCRIGAYVMIGGLSGVAQDVPPFVIANGQRAQIVGLNSVGLRRCGFDQERRLAIKRAYRTLYESRLKQAEALKLLREQQPTVEVLQLIEFVEQSSRGLISRR
jgi:UDP-N-acetylglucosamine acyltransferase